MKKIAVDTGDFEFIRQGDYIYVDKTRFLYDIVSHNRFYFLSRPRRFGKSLTISTLRALFDGKKELFKGLYIYQTNWSWEKYPIIELDFNTIETQTCSLMIKKIDEKLDTIASIYHIDLMKSTVPAKFAELIIKLHYQYQKGVVILVDEYDKPIISHLGLGEEPMATAKKNQEFLKVFYDNLKAGEVERAIKTVFITGVSKFSKVSIFSALNNLIELDKDPDFTSMLGYTEEELYSNFKDHVAAFAHRVNQTVDKTYEDIKFMYNGFRFTEEDVLLYNPYSIGLSLRYRKLDDFWFESGTPSFLIQLIKENRYDVTRLENLRVDSSEVKTYDIDSLNIEALLLQSGYLTIKEIQGRDIYALGFPNNEVRIGFNKHLLRCFASERIELPLLFDLKRAIRKDDLDEFFALVKAIFSSIPYSIIAIGDNLLGKELYFHTIFYLCTSLMADNDLNIYPEVLTNRGRIDMVFVTTRRVYIIEFKCNQSADRAIEQIKRKGYEEKYKLTGKERTLIGIDFDTDTRNIKEWKRVNL